MSRSGYGDDDCETWEFIRWRGAVASAINGARGQAFLKEMLAALDAMPEKRLITKAIQDEYDSNAVCAIGAVGRARGLDMERLDPEDPETVAGVFGIADALTKEIVYENDEATWRKTPEERWAWMRRWVESRIRA